MSRFKRLLVNCKALLAYQYAKFLLDAGSGTVDTRLTKFEGVRRAEDEESSKLALILGAVLRACPNWFEGHLRLGRMAVDTKEALLAYSSAQALLLLALSKQEQSLAYGLLGESQMLLGKLTEAKSYFNKSLDLYSSERTKDRLVSCLISLGDLKEAQTLLSEIPEERRSPELVLAASYVDDKVSQQS